MQQHKSDFRHIKYMEWRHHMRGMPVELLK